MRPLLFVRSVVFAFVFLSSLGGASAADPVKDLQQILSERPDWSNKERMADYQKRLDKQVKAIQRPGDLRRALMLGELREEFIMQFMQQPGNPPDEENLLGKVYQKVRADLVKQLQDELRKALQAKDSARRLAAITFLADMARDESRQDSSRNMVPNPGGEQPPSRRFTSRMTADLREVLGKDEEPRVRAATVGALVAIAPGTKQTLEDLKALLRPDRDVVERRAAAKALRLLSEWLSVHSDEEGGRRGPQMRLPQEATLHLTATERSGIAPQRRQTVLAQQPPARPPIERERLPSRLQQSLAAIVTAAGLGLSDQKDATVRLLCLETIRQALQQSLQHSQPHEVSRPLAAAVNEQTPAVIALLGDGDLKVCLAAHQVLETTATARRTLRGIPLGREDERFLPPPEKRPAEEAKLLDGILKALPALKRSLANKEVRVRLAALYVLETLADEAAIVVDEIAKSLKDENGFVRWGAVRVLNNLAPRQAEKAVPALAEALKDNNKTVRLAASQALRRYGPQAKTAVNPLTQAVQDAEPQVRLATIQALAAIGPEARPAAAAVVKVLADSEQKPKVRAAAAQALSQLGPLDADAKKALTKALEDSEESVRQAASETLLGEGLSSPGKE